MLNIVCLAYNQKDYIRDCLDGFVMQKTAFRFNAIVHDDASADGTADIIREYAEKYPDIIIPVYEEVNQFQTGGNVFAKMLPHITGKYIAECEGDDYWIDPLKLQKQVDFLEEHQEFALSCHRCYNRYEPNEELVLQPNRYFDSEEGRGKDWFEFDRYYPFIVDWVTHTHTVVFRGRDMEGLIRFAAENRFVWFRDVHIIYYLLGCGKGMCHSFRGGVYRHNRGGIHSSKSFSQRHAINFLVKEEIALQAGDKVMKEAALQNFYRSVEGGERFMPVNRLRIQGYLYWYRMNRCGGRLTLKYWIDKLRVFLGIRTRTRALKAKMNGNGEKRDRV